MHPKKVLLTGVNGQVGHALLPMLSEYNVVALSRQQLDLTSVDEIKRVVSEIKPNLIINPAAYTAVDKAESEPELAHAINSVAPGVLAQEAAKLGAAMMHFSTDYVYDGTKTTPYVETDPTHPLGVYASTKLAGEDAVRAAGLPHLILRTSWVYGHYGKNFMKTILGLAATRESLRVVADQHGAPTSSQTIAQTVHQIIDKWHVDEVAQTGVYHLTNSGETTWHGFACEMVTQYLALNKTPALMLTAENIAAISTAEYPTPAARPANSRLDTRKLKQTFGVDLPHWKEALSEELRQLVLV